MPKSSILRQLSDDDLLQVHHMIRRDAMTDLEIAKWVESTGLDLADNDSAKSMVVVRYRATAAYQTWLDEWKNRGAERDQALALQRERFEAMTEMCQEGSGEGFEPLTRSLQARLLTLAAEASDDDLKAATGSRGWVKNILRIVQIDLHDTYRQKVEELKGEIERLLTAPDGARVDYAEVVGAVDKIMGLGKRQ